ncbi:hypothetical protein KDN24_05605 [Bacillus sp. Bva_UNVM-123]|uniref:hypothetical protein n=1 Tax=Bacillus sp. Bva_UNVM-123 TaxID=2829798 RepID=UPI00391FB33B
MLELLERLYDETYSPKLTPQTLLTNLNLSNYIEINFKKAGGYLIANTHCILQNGLNAEYKYYFKDDLLYMLESFIEEKTEIIYDREKEKQKLISHIKDLENNHFVKEVYA